MFNLVPAVGVTLVSSIVPPVTLQHYKDHYWLSMPAGTASEAHNTGNIFAREVGHVLKQQYPSRIWKPAIHLSISSVNGEARYLLTWSCSIRPVKVTGKNRNIRADYYFDRRGTMRPGETLREARASVEHEIRESRKVILALSSIPRARVPNGFVQEAQARSPGGGYWYLQEYFIIAPK